MYKIAGTLFKAVIPILSFLTIQCDLFDWDSLIIEDPTKPKMEGVWQVTEAYNEDGEDILADVSFPITAFYLNNDNTLQSTAGPMAMYLVYGKGNYTQIASKIDQLFNYTSLNLNGGSWFIADGPVDRFTIEFNLPIISGQTTLKTVLELLDINVRYLNTVVYHKFTKVKVTFDDMNDSTMTWEFDDSTEAVYNTVDTEGNKVLWNDFSNTSFSQGKFVLTKRVKDMKDLINDAQK